MSKKTSNKQTKLTKEAKIKIDHLEELYKSLSGKIDALDDACVSTLRERHYLNRIAKDIADLKAGKKVAADPTNVSTTDVDKQQVYTVLDPKASGDVTQQIRPLSMSFHQDVATIDNKSNVKYTIQVTWDDTQDNLLSVTFDETLRETYTELVKKLEEIQKLIDGKNYDLAKDQTVKFLEDLAVLKSKFQTNLVHASIDEDLGCAKIKLSTSGKKVVAQLSDIYVNYVLSKLAKVEELPSSPMSEARYIGEEQCNADNFKLAYYSPDFGSIDKLGMVAVWKEKSLLGVYKLSYADYGKLYRKFAFSLSDLGYQPDRFQKFVKVEKKAETKNKYNSYRAFTGDRDEEAWKDEINADLKAGSTSLKDGQTVECVSDNGTFIFKIVEGKPVRIGKEKKAAVTMQIIFFDTVDEANKWQEEVEKQKALKEKEQVANTEPTHDNVQDGKPENLDRTETNGDKNPEKQDVLPSRREESPEGSNKQDFNNSKSNDQIIPTPSSKVEKNIGKKADANVFSKGDSVIHTRTNQEGIVSHVFPDDLSHVEVIWNVADKSAPESAKPKSIIDTEFIKKASISKDAKSEKGKKDCPSSVCNGKLIPHKKINSNHEWLICDRCGQMVETDKRNKAVGEPGKPLNMVREEYKGNEKQVERKYDNDPNDIKNLKVRASASSVVQSMYTALESGTGKIPYSKQEGNWVYTLDANYILHITYHETEVVTADFKGKKVTNVTNGGFNTVSTTRGINTVLQSLKELGYEVPEDWKKKASLMTQKEFLEFMGYNIDLSKPSKGVVKTLDGNVEWEIRDGKLLWSSNGSEINGSLDVFQQIEDQLNSTFKEASANSLGMGDIVRIKPESITPELQGLKDSELVILEVEVGESSGAYFVEQTSEPFEGAYAVESDLEFLKSPKQPDPKNPSKSDKEIAEMKEASTDKTAGDDAYQELAEDVLCTINELQREGKTSESIKETLYKIYSSEVDRKIVDRMLSKSEDKTASLGKIAVTLQKGEAYVVRYIEPFEYEDDPKVVAILKSFDKSVDVRVEEIAKLLKEEILPNLPEDFTKIKEVSWDTAQIDTGEIAKIVENYEDLHKNSSTVEQPLKDTATVKEASKEPRIDIINRIVNDQQYEEVDGMIIDMQTANLLKQVYEAIGPTNQERFNTMPLTKLVDFAWKMTKSSSVDVTASSDFGKFVVMYKGIDIRDRDGKYWIPGTIDLSFNTVDDVKKYIDDSLSKNAPKIAAIPIAEMNQKAEEWYAATTTVQEQIKNQQEKNVQELHDKTKGTDKIEDKVPGLKEN